MSGLAKLPRMKTSWVLNSTPTLTSGTVTWLENGRFSAIFYLEENIFYNDHQIYIQDTGR